MHNLKVSQKFSSFLLSFWRKKVRQRKTFFRFKSFHYFVPDAVYGAFAANSGATAPSSALVAPAYMRRLSSLRSATSRGKAARLIASVPLRCDTKSFVSLTSLRSYTARLPSRAIAFTLCSQAFSLCVFLFKIHISCLTKSKFQYILN